MIAPFGVLPDGRRIERVTLRAGSVVARVMTFGATLQSLEMPDRFGVMDDIVLGHETLQGYVDHRSFFGATIGRVANRIAGGRFQLDGREIVLPRNDGAHTLHGGPEGFDRKVWTIEDHDDNSVAMSVLSPDGDQGFPGVLQVRAIYRLTEVSHGTQLRITLTAQTDAPTPVALTNHSFFALAGARGLGKRPESALEYLLTVPASRYLPVDATLIPQRPAPVGATAFDFRTGRQPITAIRAKAVSGYDHTLCLERGPITLSDAVTGRSMTMTVNQPGLQVYTGNFLDQSVTGKQGRAYAAHDAICLEPQSWPNAVNMPADWGSQDIILRPAERYLNEMTLTLTSGR